MSQNDQPACPLTPTLEGICIRETQSGEMTDDADVAAIVEHAKTCASCQAELQRLTPLYAKKPDSLFKKVVDTVFWTGMGAMATWQMLDFIQGKGRWSKPKDKP